MRQPPPPGFKTPNSLNGRSLLTRRVVARAQGGCPLLSEAVLQALQTASACACDQAPDESCGKGYAPRKLSLRAMFQPSWSWNASARTPSMGYTPTGFATAAEVECPLELCKRWAQLIAQTVAKHTAVPTSELHAHPDKRTRTAARKQTKVPGLRAGLVSR